MTLQEQIKEAQLLLENDLEYSYLDSDDIDRIENHIEDLQSKLNNQ